jgi:hypothetical protein
MARSNVARGSEGTSIPLGLVSGLSSVFVCGLHFPREERCDRFLGGQKLEGNGGMVLKKLLGACHPI